jgi:microcystin degradation protein MlrC
MPHRIAVGSLFIECNHLGGIPADLETFRRSELRFGDEFLNASSGTVGGMLQTLGQNDTEVFPLLVASACPSGPVTAECYRYLKQELLQRIEQSAPLDGVLLALHGSAAADVANAGDLEGDLLQAVRETVGTEIPIVATLDLHAHVTERMVQNADALLAWETYPHRDAFETGQRGARALLDILTGQLRPVMAYARVPVIVGGINGQTEGDGPFADVMRFAKSHERQGTVYSTGAFLVHPYLDLPDMGGGGLVITDGDADTAVRVATEIASLYWLKRFDLEPKVVTPEEAIRLSQSVVGGPILLVETADCCGGGASGDSVATLEALLECAPLEACLVPVVDAAAASACQAAGVGASVTLSLGHQLDPRWGDPVTVTGEVVRLTDGVFTYRGGIWDDQTGNMGTTAVVRVGSIEIMIASHGTYDWRGEQYESVGMDASSARFVVVKNPMNFSLAYGDIARAVHILDTPGPTPASVRSTSFRNLKRPYFPLDESIPGLVPTVAMSRRALIQQSAEVAND